MSELEFTVIIPARNEAEDVERCLQSVLAADGPVREVLVVDGGSTDGTREIVSRYRSAHPVQLILEEGMPSVAQARNVAARRARGNVLVFVNADNVLSSDFFHRLSKHYEDGAVFVVCESQVENSDRLIPRYVQARHMEYRNGRFGELWSEGFSCRKEAWSAVGGFPPFPGGSAAEDTSFGLRLRERFPAGGRIDRSIIVRHVADSDPSVFLRKRIGRGSGRYYFDRARGVPRRTLFGRSYGRIVLLVLGLLRLRPLSAVVLGGVLGWLTAEAAREGVAFSKWEGGREKTPFAVVSLADSLCRKAGYLFALAQDLVAEVQSGRRGAAPGTRR